MIKARASPSCELCKRKRGQGRAAVQALPEETVTHIQSAQCTAQKKSVIGAHNKWQNEDGAWEKVRGVAALEGGKKILWNRHWQNEDGAWEKVRGIAALKKKKGGGGG
jgi:hypothetical protein